MFKKIFEELERKLKKKYIYFRLEYSASYCGIGESLICKVEDTPESINEMELLFIDWANEDAQDYYESDKDDEELEVYTVIEEIDKEIYLHLKAHGYDDFLITE